MKLIYDINNQLNISQLIDNYELPQKYRAKAMECYVCVYEYISDRWNNTLKQKREWVKDLNILTYMILSGDTFPILWDPHRPFEELIKVSEDEVKDKLGEYYLTLDSIVWDVQIVFPEETVKRIDQAVETVQKSRQAEMNMISDRHTITSTTANRPVSNYKKANVAHSADLKVQTVDQVNLKTANKLTTMDEIMLDPGFPYFPNVDFNDYWILGEDEFGEEYGIPKSLPLIPQCQADISVTTDVNLMVDSDLLKLYPNHIMKLRSTFMYQHYEKEYPKLEYDDDLGIIFPIAGYTLNDVRENILKYPDIINMGLGRIGKKRISESSVQSEVVWEEFHKRIEINGKLELVTKSLWESLPELRILPPNRAFQQEYVVRKYLIERDNGISHEKDIFGALYPFTTLFMPQEEYIKKGYKDTVELARRCVKSRVCYLRSRNPMLRRLGLEYNLEGELISE